MIEECNDGGSSRDVTFLSEPGSGVSLVERVSGEYLSGTANRKLVGFAV